VGGAIAEALKFSHDVLAYDVEKPTGYTFEDVVTQCDFVFICVPTPDNNERQDLVHINEVVSSIQNAKLCTRKTFIVKSTVTPGTCRDIQESLEGHTVVMNPEFLTERTAKLDFINQARIVLGGETPDTLAVWNYVYSHRFKHTPVFFCSLEEAELVKYMCNGFFAMKITFLNEFYDLANARGLDFQKLVQMWLADGRIGNSHTDVPGHDGKLGYGGKCFPKDVKAIVRWAEEHEQELGLLDATDAINNFFRGK